MVTRNYWWPEFIKEVKQYRRMQSVSEDEEWSRDASRKIKTKYSIRKTIAIYISGLYYKVTSIKRS